MGESMKFRYTVSVAPGGQKGQLVYRGHSFPAALWVWFSHARAGVKYVEMQRRRYG